MNSANYVVISGAVGRDPEIRATGGGTLVATFSLALSEGKKDAAGNWLDSTIWVDVKAFGKTAETVRDRVTKGSKVFAEGKINVESWDDKQTGKKRSKTLVIANHLSVIPTARSSSSQSENTSPEIGGSVPAGKRLPPSLEKLIESTEIGDEDIPF